MVITSQEKIEAGEGERGGEHSNNLQIQEAGEPCRRTEFLPLLGAALGQQALCRTMLLVPSLFSFGL